MKDLSLYIHIPFCKNICHYCAFLTFANKGKKIPEYIEALLEEIATKSRRFKNYQIETIYFGGGTPSLIEPTELSKVMEKIFQKFSIHPKVEVSIECNPESIDPERLKAYKKMGINRISLGIQSFDQKTLWKIARPHDHLTIFKALKAIQESGFKNYGADFIMGLPYQTLPKFQDQLKQILTFKIPHLSFYFLSYDTKRIDLFQKDCPDEETQIQIYHHLIATLKKAGYLHYEVSNYAQPGFECQHNKRYWNQKEYFGLGLGAHSYLDSTCTENETDFDKYLKNPLTIHEKVEIDQELHKMEYILLHLRTQQGIDLQDYEKRFKDKNLLQKKAQPYAETGKIILTAKNLRASEEGFLILDRITQDLI